MAEFYETMRELYGSMNEPNIIDDPAPIRNERDICKYCKRDFGGTVGDRSKMTERTIICGSCSCMSSKDRKALRQAACEL